MKASNHRKADGPLVRSPNTNRHAPARPLLQGMGIAKPVHYYPPCPFQGNEKLPAEQGSLYQCIGTLLLESLSGSTPTDIRLSARLIEDLGADNIDITEVIIPELLIIGDLPQAKEEKAFQNSQGNYAGVTIKDLIDEIVKLRAIR